MSYWCKGEKCLFSTKTFSTLKEAEEHCGQPATPISTASKASKKKKETKKAEAPKVPAPSSSSSSDGVTLEVLEANALKQGTVVRSLKKAEPRDNEAIAVAVAELKRLKALCETAKPVAWDRQPFDDMMIGRFVYAPSFEAYGGVAGFYDYGPVGCAIKSNLLTVWRDHFVLNDNMHQVDCPAMTPEVVLAASGHVERFTDIMVKDTVNGECIRADHLLEDVMEVRMEDGALSAALRKEAQLIHAKADAYSKEEISEIFSQFNIQSPSGNPLTAPDDFNMMFASQIGPSGQLKGFLRPETAQGIFLAFNRLYKFNNERLPFAGAQIGVAYRNEISPRSGLLRVREFQMAEIEHFVDPSDKTHPKFKTVADLVLPFLSSNNQEQGRPLVHKTIGEAVAEGLVDNETLGYFIARIYLFLTKCGADPTRIRFRQHLKNEMAHYATDCWDAEMKTSYGWVECVGCADRSAYDLKAHTKGSGIKMEARKVLSEPIVEDKVVINLDKKKMGKIFAKDTATVKDYVANLSNEQALEIGTQLKEHGKAIITITKEGGDVVQTLTPEVASMDKIQVKIHEIKFTPSVIEPAFGIGRIIYCILEHVYDNRVKDNGEKDLKRGFLKLPPIIAPIKVSLLPLMAKNEEMITVLDGIKVKLNEHAVSSQLDDSSVPIGRRYARTDEIAIPFAITVDTKTIDKDHKLFNTVTLRERDSMLQIRLPITEVPKLVSDLAEGRLLWSQAIDTYPITDTKD
eukprot:m.55273 g.55273  ORF g.55273 m.55273 type:complete len:743 (+) comp22044_c0_seq1:222-2450(+)